jgi:3-hydroxyisobutyrate dehydrogenase-like beta-hydroxyacid dehydrogenase
MEFGFIGLGRMGRPMAARLIEAGHRLIVFDTRQDAVASLTGLGAQEASSPAEIADRVETIMTCLPTPDVVFEVATGERGVIKGKRVRTFVDFSTTGSLMAKRIAVSLAARGIVQIDSPVSGGVPGAEKGTLAVMVSGPRAQFDSLEPVLKVFGRPFYVGAEPGLGQTMKLLNNLLSANALAATCEAVAMGVRAGLAPEVMIEVLNAGTGRNCASLDKFPRAILPGSYNGGFATGLLVKDLRLFAEEAQSLGLALDVASAVVRRWEEAKAELGSEADSTRMMQSIERRAGVAIHGKR